MDSRGVGLVGTVVVGELAPGLVGMVGRTVRVGPEVPVGEPVDVGGVVGVTVNVGAVVGAVVLGGVVGAVVVGFDVSGGVEVGAVREDVGRREDVDPGAGRRKIEDGDNADAELV